MRRILGFFMASLAVVMTGTVRADVIYAESSADFIEANVNLDVLGGSLVNAQLDNVVPDADTAPPVFNHDNSLVNVNVSAGSVPLLVNNILAAQAGTATSTVISDVDGGVGSRATSGTHTIEDLDLSVVDSAILFAPDLISITANALTVTSAVTGDSGALIAAGTMTVDNLVVSVLGATVATVDGTVAPNFGIDLSTVLGGATLVLNEQTLTGDGITQRGISTNAINISLENVGVQLGALDAATLDGSIVVAPTNALMTASVPEPSSWLLMGMMGLAGLVFHRRALMLRPC